MYHFYKINRTHDNLPNYAVRNHSNGVTGYPRLDERLTSELNIIYLGYMSEQQVEERVNVKRYGKALSKLKA